MIRRLMMIAAIALASAPTVVSAQPAAAVGKPLPDGSMRDGTLMVKLIAGDRSKPVTGAEITLTMVTPSGAQPPATQVARTDSEGRATFSDIPEGVMVKLTTAGPDSSEVASSQFPMPQTGGIRVLLSTLTMNDGGGMPGGPMMSPRAASGTPRPEQADSRDSITVRISYDDFADPASLEGVPVTLIAFKHDQTVSGRIVPTDAAGRAIFTGLDARGATSYFAMTMLPRNGGLDRLASNPMLLDGERGLRVMLSSEKRTSSSPPLDDLGLLDPQPTRGSVAPGQVRVSLIGVPVAGTEVELLDALTGKPLQTTKSGEPLLDYDRRGGFFSAPVADPALAAGTLALTVTKDGRPVEGVTLWLRPAGSTTPSAAPAGRSDAAGAITATGLATGVPLDAVLLVGDDAIVKQTFTLPARGGLRASGTLTWDVAGQGGALFNNVPAGEDRAYVVRTVMRSQVYLSSPFQLTPARGAAVTVRVMPRIMFGFSLTSWIDDVYMGVRGQFAIRNMSWAPYVAGVEGKPDEIVMPLPVGFSGAVVRDDFQEFVGVDPTRGFVVRRPIPPGGLQFIAGFSLKVEGGEVAWDMPLPLGAYESGIEIKRDGTDMKIEMPGVRGVKVEEATDDRGRFYVLSPITIVPGQRMVFRLHDLPEQPAWKRWSRVIVGSIVLFLVMITALFALWRPRAAVAPARFDALLDELAALEASGADPARRTRLMAELEALYRQSPPR